MTLPIICVFIVIIISTVIYYFSKKKISNLKVLSSILIDSKIENNILLGLTKVTGMYMGKQIVCEAYYRMVQMKVRVNDNYVYLQNSMRLQSIYYVKWTEEDFKNILNELMKNVQDVDDGKLEASSLDNPYSFKKALLMWVVLMVFIIAIDLLLG